MSIFLEKVIAAGKSTTAANKTTEEYEEILEALRGYILENHAADVDAMVEDESAKVALKDHIASYLMQNKTHISGIDDDELRTLLYDDMVGLPTWLKNLINNQEVEEIDVNAWNDVDVIWSRGGMKKHDEHFRNPREAIDVAKKLTARGNHIIDEGRPIADSYFLKGMRISALISPVVDEDIGVAFSIRKQIKTNITEQQLLDWGTGTKEELDFIRHLAKYAVPIIFSGETGSGKTADIQFAVSQIPDGKRVYVIEETRELNFIRTDDKGNITTSVIHTRTRQSDELQRAINENDLLRKALRFTPKYIVPAEMRGEEAYTATKAAMTGHCVISSLHAENARDTYYRIFCLCRENPEAQSFNDDMLYKMIVKAFPIVVFKHKLEDNSRKIMEIVEAVGYDAINHEAICNTLFSYKIEENRRDENGRLIIKGSHKVGCGVSQAIVDKFLLNGATPDEIVKYRAKEDIEL